MSEQEEITNKVGLHFRYEDHAGRETIKRLKSYTFNGGDTTEAHNRVAPKGKIFVLKCACGSNNWTENGRFINEYECDCCGEYVEVNFTNHGRDNEGK